MFPSDHGTVIKAAQRTHHICSTVIYMQLKFHVSRDEPDRRGRGEREGEGRLGWRKEETEENMGQNVENKGKGRNKKAKGRKEVACEENAQNVEGGGNNGEERQGNQRTKMKEG